MKTNAHLFIFFTQRGHIQIKSTLFHYFFLNIHTLQIICIFNIDPPYSTEEIKTSM